jgi:hypothetical protein
MMLRCVLVSRMLRIVVLQWDIEIDQTDCLVNGIILNTGKTRVTSSKRKYISNNFSYKLVPAPCVLKTVFLRLQGLLS